MVKIDLSGRRALVCGASQGIGRAIALALAQAGAEVSIAARREEVLNEVLVELKSITPESEQHKKLNHNAFELDLKDLSQVNQVSKMITAEGPIHILVNNSGGPPSGPLLEADLSLYEEFMRAHILASQTFVKNFLQGMKADKYGRIINVISTSVKSPLPNLGVSNTIRGAMASWAKTLSNEVGPFGITVNNILPGLTETPRLESLIDANSKKTGLSHDQVVKSWQNTVPLRRFAKPEETASAALFLASPLAAYITGVSLPVDGGRLGCL